MLDPALMRQRWQKPERQTAEENSLSPHRYLLVREKKRVLSGDERMIALMHGLLATAIQSRAYCRCGIWFEGLRSGCPFLENYMHN
jgi:hypothetical protein